MTEPKLIYSFTKNPMEEVRFELGEYKNRLMLNLRIFYLADSGNGEEAKWLPTKKGVTLDFTEFMPKLKEGIDRAWTEYLEKYGPEPEVTRAVSLDNGQDAQ
jgi:hypothetical protein